MPKAELSYRPDAGLGLIKGRNMSRRRQKDHRNQRGGWETPVTCSGTLETAAQLRALLCATSFVMLGCWESRDR